MFRDLSCLPAGSSLEAQLFERLDRSEHLLVLASPEALNSHGMEMESQHWFSRIRSGQVLIIVTSGNEQTWEEIRNHLLPPAIRANLTTEPLWIPLQHRRADIVANPNSHELRGRLVEDLRQVLLCFYPGRDWGQLRGEERSQRRRALGLMMALTLLFLVLAVAAVGFATYAQRERLLAQSRQMAAQSANLKVQSPALLTRSILLAVESLRINPNLEADQTIRTGIPLLDKPAFRIPYQANLSHIVPSPTGELLATVGYLEKHVDVWRIADRQHVASLPHEVAIEDVTFEPTGTILAIAGLNGKVVVLWNLSTMKEAARLDCGSAVNTLAFSHHGRYLATGQDDHTVRIWRMSLEPKVSFRQVAVLKHDDQVFGVTFSRDDRYLATSYLNFAVLWKLKHQGNDLSATFLGYVQAEAAVNSIALSPDDKYLATGICCGRPFRLWDVEQRALVTIMPDEGPASVGFSPDGKYITAASRDGTAGVWKITPGESGSVDSGRSKSRPGSIKLDRIYFGRKVPCYSNRRRNRVLGAKR